MVDTYIDLSSDKQQTVEEMIDESKEKERLQREKEKLFTETRKKMRDDKLSRVQQPIKRTIFKPSPRPRTQRVFGRKPQPQDYSKEQRILRGMFGHGERVMTNFDGRSLPKINNTLTSGGGLIKSGDYEAETAGLFGLRNRRRFI